MSSSAIIASDCEHGDSVQQPSTGKQRGTRRRSHVNNISPTSSGDTSAGDTRPRMRRRTQPTTAVELNTNEGTTWHKRQERRPATAVEHNTNENENNTRCIRQERRPATAAVEPNTSQRNTAPRVQRIPATANGDPDYDEENIMPTRLRGKRVFEKDLTPEERAIPNTTLLHDLGYHLSAYARVGRGPPTQNLYCRGAWCNAVKLYNQAHEQYKDLFIAAGFGDFLKIEPVEVPAAYSLALVERWFSKTNTLHLPNCEIGPTPVDWTMVTGVPFGGRSIGVNSISMNRALELLGVGKNAIVDNKIGLSKIKPSDEEVENEPATDEVKEKVFRRLFLYVVASCFFSNNRSVISHKLVECLERIDQVRNYDWGAMTYAAFLAGMRRKVTAEIGALTAFWQFLPFWAFEYLDINRPKDPKDDVFPRAMRWINLKRLSDNEASQFFSPHFIASRCQLDCVEESEVTWQPYLASAEYSSLSMWSTINLAKKRIAFRSIDTWEYYLGERCLRQLGFPCRVPINPPHKMCGNWKGHLQDQDLWNGISAENLVNERLEYSSWFANASVGRILNVNQYLGGLVTARKVFDEWKAKHRPDLISISQSEYKKLKEDRDAAERKLAKLQEELSKARGVTFQSKAREELSLFGVGRG